MHLAPILSDAGLTKGIPRFFGFGYAGSCQGALGASGDFYDVLPLSDNSLLMVVADVMGKGYAASIVAGTLRTLVSALAQPGICPADYLGELNEIMFEQLSGADTFVTMQIAVADLHHRQLEVGNAGHCPLLISTPDGFIQAVAPEGMPLGIERHAAFASETVAMDPFTSVLLYTDGITDARNQAGEMFGQSRLENCLALGARRGFTASALKTLLLQELMCFQGSRRATDDQTLLILSDETPRESCPVRSNNLSWVLQEKMPLAQVALDSITTLQA